MFANREFVAHEIKNFVFPSFSVNITPFVVGE